MQLVILHHHLNRGGVTSVIENHLRSLATLEARNRPTQVTVIYGGRDAAWKQELAAELPFEFSLVAVREIEYDNFREDSSELFPALQAVLSNFDRDSTILHVHNHSLGKNSELAGTICRLAEDGWRLLLQIHDFAEDLRPANYQHLLRNADSVAELQSELYPQADHIHYSLLNHRDQQLLADAGIDDERLHLLPNPVQLSEFSSVAEEAAKNKSNLARTLVFPEEHHFVLYPVRPIRRKNLGEFLLWSLLADNCTFALTLAPLNPTEQAAYQQWMEFAAELDLPVRFEIATKTSLAFSEVYSAADAIITTSVAEGFGMVYLEASLAGKHLIGRNLPGVCADFEAAGMEFPGLSQSMEIPSDSVDLNAVRLSHQQQIKQLSSEYGLAPVDEEATGDSSLLSGDTIDFARLESSQQRDFLRRAKAEPSLQATLRDLNPTVQSLGNLNEDQLRRTTANNCHVISQHYSPEVIGETLHHVYQRLLAARPGRVTRQPAIAQAVLNSFVHPSQLFPIRLES